MLRFFREQGRKEAQSYEGGSMNLADSALVSGGRTGSGRRGRLLLAAARLGEPNDPDLLRFHGGGRM